MFPWNFFPFTKENQEKLQQMKPEEINQFVQNIMGKMFNSPFPHGMPQNQNEFRADVHPFQTSNNTMNNQPNLQYSVFETHEDVYIRIVIESEDWLNSLRLTHTSHLLILEHIPEHHDIHKIPLPALVKKNKTTARFKDGTLEVKLSKNIDFQLTEIDITDT